MTEASQDQIPSCSICKTRLSGKKTICHKDTLFCDPCYNQCLCPRCHEHTLADGVQCKRDACRYRRMVCDQCRKPVDNGVLRATKLLCDNCNPQKQTVVPKLSMHSDEEIAHASSGGCVVCGPHTACVHGEAWM
jgi:hypothetical protein